MTIHLWIIRKFAHQFIITVITSLRWAKSPGKCHGSAQLGDFMEAQMHIIIAFIPAYDYVIFSHKYICVCVFRHMFCAILPWSSICLDVYMHDRCIYICLIFTRNSQTPRCQKHDTHHHIGIKIYITMSSYKFYLGKKKHWTHWSS
jgi:hypothetical protein